MNRKHKRGKESFDYKMITPKPHSNSVSLADTFHFLAIVGLVTVFCWYAKTVMITFVVSIMFVYILEPSVNWMEKHGLTRGISILISIVVTLALIITFGYFLVIRIQPFTDDIPKYRNKLQKAATDVYGKIKKLEKATQEILPQPTAEQTAREVKIQEPSKFQDALTYILGILTHVALIPFLVYFILLEQKKLRKKLVNLFGEHNREAFNNGIDQMQSQIMGFLSGNFISIFILWVVSFLGFLLTGIDYPFLLAGFFAVCNIIPVIGPVIGLLPPVLLTFLETDSWIWAAWVAGFGLLVHLFYANYLTPKLIGKRVMISPVVVFLSMLYWGWVWGATGLVLAIPMVAFLKTICDHVEPWKHIGELLGD